MVWGKRIFTDANKNNKVDYIQQTDPKDTSLKYKSFNHNNLNKPIRDDNPFYN